MSSHTKQITSTSIYYLDLRQQNERVQVVVREYDFLQLGESLKFVQVLVVDNKVKPHVSQVHLFDLIVEFGPLENFKGISKDVEYPV